MSTWVLSVYVIITEMLYFITAVHISVDVRDQSSIFAKSASVAEGQETIFQKRNSLLHLNPKELYPIKKKIVCSPNQQKTKSTK